MLNLNNKILSEEPLLYILAGIGIVLLILVSGLIFNRKYIIKIFYLSSISVISAIVYLILDAPDVGLTEAAIGACLTSVVYIISLTKIRKEEESSPAKARNLFGVIVVSVIFGCFVILDQYLPEFGNKDNIIHTEVVEYYIKNTKSEIGIPSYVAAILASYRGFDTFGETLVILIAGIAIFLIMGVRDEKR